MSASEGDADLLASSATSMRSSHPRVHAAPRHKHSVHWFRKGLRLHDNPSLRVGIKGATTLRCIFILDPWFAGSSNVGINKWRFLLQCLDDLDRSLRKFNSRLFVIRGQPADALPKLFKEWGTTNLTFEEDPEPFGRVRDQNIMAMCKELNISVVSKVSHTLYELEKIIEKNGGRPPLTYHQFQNVVASMDPPPTAMPPITTEDMRGCCTPTSDDHDDKYGVPTLEELGFDIEGLKPAVWVGGETEALTRLEHHLERKAWVASFGRPKMTPQSLLPSQTGLSPYLRFGCLSTRLFYYQLTDLYQKIKKAVPPLSLHGQLLWREFFYCAATRNEKFDKMQGNPICVQIPWDRNPEAIAKWANGQTGFPWIDAIMTQLREEGWIHHLARHAVACFLTRGDLWVSWEEGMKVFEELLLDADWSVNAGMWMWLSCSSFFQQFFHCYCPVRFGRKADPNGDYIRRYLPVLKNFPTRYIHEPWIAPESLQRSAKCVVGKDYPKPMVNHGIASRINLERMKQVYTQLSRYRGSGLLATVPSSQSSSAHPQNKSTSSSQLNAHASASLSSQCQMQDRRRYDHQPLQQISPQSQPPPPSTPPSPSQQNHQQQQQLQHQHHNRSHSHNLHHQQHHQPQPLPHPHHLHQNQLHQQPLLENTDVSSHLMAPPKSCQVPHSQQQQLCTIVIPRQQNHCIDVGEDTHSPFSSQSQQLPALYVQSACHLQHQQTGLQCETQSYQLELDHQDFSAEQIQQDEQRQWVGDSKWHAKDHKGGNNPNANTNEYNYIVLRQNHAQEHESDLDNNLNQ